jgi:uncharacterized protein
MDPAPEPPMGQPTATDQAGPPSAPIEPRAPARPPAKTSDQQMWQVLAHASAFVQVIGIPSLVGPLVVWLIKRDDPAVDPHARAALNFQLSLLIYFIVGGIIGVIFAITVIGLVVAIPIFIFLLVLVILELVFALMASLAASRGELYDYPLSIELIKA